tara:strand:+ start:47 stop:937 length:891 start_codon:yes stop_codon:yes gene_type:complete
MIRAGMTIAEAILQLTKGFRKMMGRDPDGLEKIKIQQEAVKRLEDVNKVVDMEGNVIDTSKGIMGGKQIKEITEDTGEGFIDFVRKTDPEGAAKLQKEEDRIRAMIEASNKKAAKNLKEKKYQDAIKKEKAKADADPDYIPDIIDPEDMAQGGRAGFKDGMDRRTFMKIMGGLATLPIVGKFAKGAKLAAPAVKKVTEITAPALDKIIDMVMSAGKLVSQSGRRLKELTTKKKLKDIEVEEDMMDGPSYTIKTKDKTIYYKPGKRDEMGFDDDIIEVIEDTVTKKAGGGIARMLGE